MVAVIAAACSDPARLASSTDSAPLGPTIDPPAQELTTEAPPTLPPLPTPPPLPPLPTPPPLPTTTTTEPPAPVSVAVVGNLSDCGSRSSEVAALVDRADVVLVAGDLTVGGTAAKLDECFLPLYGDRLSTLYAVPGNEDFAFGNGGPFFDVVASSATGSTPGKGWFAATIGAWQIIGLNSQCADVGGCNVGSEQYQWLDEVLRAEPAECRLAIWHDARFTSAADIEDADNMGPIYGRLDGSGADILLTGGPALYERLGPLRPSGDPGDEGMVNFNVGTGGVGESAFDDPRPGSRYRSTGIDGVLLLQLRADGYDWEFVGHTGERRARRSNVRRFRVRHLLTVGIEASGPLSVR